MKNLIIFAFFVIALVVVQFAQAQTVDDVVGKYISAMGGKEKLASLKTVKMEGTMSVQGTDLTITSTRSHMVGLRLDLEIMGTSNYQVANTTKGAAFWPIRGMTDPEDMDPEQYKAVYNQLDVQGALLNYKEKGTQVEYIGTEKVDGAEASQLKVTYKNGIVSNFFIDIKTNRLVKISGKMSVNGQEIDVETGYADYKQNADGYWFAYTVNTTQGTIIYDKITTNMPVDDSLFKI